MTSIHPCRRLRRVAALVPIVPLIALALPPGPATADNAIQEGLVRVAGFSKSDVRSIGDSILVNEIEVPNRSRQAAFAGIVRIDGSGQALARALERRDDEILGEVRASGFFSEPAKPADVATLVFSDSDMEALADCHVAACKLKLSREGIDGLAAIDWSDAGATDAITEQFRKEALAYADAYRAKGDAALIVYVDKKHPVAVAETNRALIAQFEVIGRAAPRFIGALGAYPSGTTPGMSDALVWAVRDFGYRPTLAVDHLVVDVDPEDASVLALFASKTIYANHYLGGRVQIGAVIDGDGAIGVPGRYLVLVDRIEFDDDLNGLKRKLLGKGLASDLKGRMELLRRFASDGS